MVVSGWCVQRKWRRVAKQTTAVVVGKIDEAECNWVTACCSSWSVKQCKSSAAEVPCGGGRLGQGLLTLGVSLDLGLGRGGGRRERKWREGVGL